MYSKCIDALVADLALSKLVCTKLYLDVVPSLNAADLQSRTAP